MKTSRKYPEEKETRAGVALTHTAKGKPLLSVTLVTGPPKDAVFAAPAEHELPDSSPATLAAALSRILTTPTSITLSLPLAFTEYQRTQYREVVHELPGMDVWRSIDHSNAYLGDVMKKFTQEGTLHVLFLDLSSSGQPAAKLSTIETEGGEACALFSTDSKPVKSVEDTALDAIDKLVTVTVQPLLHAIYIFSPPEDSGVGSELEALVSTLKTKYPDTRIEFPTVGDVLHGAAESKEYNLRIGEIVKSSHTLCAFYTPVALRVALANGERVVCVGRNYILPREKVVGFTTGGENQTSATLEFFYGPCSIGKVVLQGLVTAKPRIQLSISCDEEGETRVCAKEEGTENQAMAELDVDILDNEEIRAYMYEQRDDETGDKGREPRDGHVLGELPA